jgi:hypothetical protein
MMWWYILYGLALIFVCGWPFAVEWQHNHERNKRRAAWHKNKK